MSTADRVHKTIRLERGLAERVKALGTEGESETATYCRVLSAGADALSAQGAGDGGEQPEAGGNQGAALIASLRSHIETLQAANERLGAQLDIKDKQIEALSVLTAQAQQATTKALDAPQAERGGGGEEGEEKRRGWWARHFG